ncbi:non-ribosomal peptide synthetase [Nocardiopsis prasina]|uniref:non-ribosomal peptide synthetase n=1 Tax=Nocardiopsis prasina TaxID=2015 RepID=UPI00034AB311|nr:non-ribosomal peptide synthetase [Nocardiopsis prasina]
MTSLGGQAFPPSPVQAGLWFASTYGTEDPTAYNQPLVLRLPVLLDDDRFVAAVRTVHHEQAALRTTFEMGSDGDLRQIVHDRLDPVVELRDSGGRDPRTWIGEQVDEVARTVFDLGTGPLARVRHLRLLSEDTSLLVFNIHHTVFDGMSWKPYLRRVEAAYTALARGDAPGRPVPRQSFEAYARWRERVADTGEPGAASRTLGYWREKLVGAPAVVPVSLAGDRAPRGTSAQTVLDAELNARVQEFCAAQGITTSMFFIAVYIVLLHRQTRHDDVLLGMPLSVREGGEDAEVVGHLTNTVVLRHRLADRATAHDVLQDVRREVLDVLRHRHAPLETVVADLRESGDHRDGTGELFNAMITVMPSHARGLDLHDWGVATWEYTSGGAKYDLALIVDEAKNHRTLIVEHASTTDDGAVIAEHLVQRLRKLIECVLAEPDTPVRELPWTGAREEAAIIESCSRQEDARELGTELTDDLFTAAVKAAPDHPALVTGSAESTYAELDARVRSVAVDLAARGVRSGAPVAVLLHPGPDLVATVLGILRAGGSYVALDPGNPVERLGFAIGDSGSTILVRDPDVDLSGADLPPGLEVHAPDDLGGDPADPVEPGRKGPGDTAYVVYTSGSTGRPKGVVITEATLANLAHCQEWISSGRRMRTLQYMSPAFDVFALELVGSLCTGGTLVIPPAHARTDFEALAAQLAEQRIERAFFPYVALRELAAVLRTSAVRLPDLREVYVTGERLVVTEDLRAMFRALPDARLINAYGPSEAHWCTAETLAADPDTWPAMPPIGALVPGVDARVLIDDDRLAPFGVEGELCIAGPVISPGYLNLPERTARAMRPDPFGPPGQRMYRTGDVVVLAPDGRLHYRGRIDDQIKIRGYRVEPGEVESALERALGVEMAAVIARASGGELRLHAFVQSGAEPRPEWRARLADLLPDYMIPATLTRVDSIPLTATGKMDRRALECRHVGRAGDATVDGSGVDRPHQSLAEAVGQDEPGARYVLAMAEVWAELLGSSPQSPDDDFFLLGGHSMLAARLHRLVRQRFDTDVALSALLNTPTLRGMAGCLAGGEGAEEGTTAQVLRDDARLRDFSVSPRREPGDGTVLLTGATGFLGSHLLDELRRAGRRIRCLVRADTEHQARRRLAGAFEKFALDPSVLDEVEVVLGDLSQPELGLGEEYRRLARSVAEVYHAAAHINFVVPYHTVRRANVDGLRVLLDLCAANRTPLRLVSTMGVFPPDSTGDRVTEDAVPGDPASLGIGYSQSKWVAEHLALQTRQAGLPVTLHRVGRIGGHDGTGASRHDDFFWLQMKSFTLLGRYPDDITDAPPVDLLPVDYVARAIVRLSAAGPDDANWHLFHDRGLSWPAIIEAIRERGYEVEPASRAQWMAALEKRAESDAQGEGLGPLVPFMREGVMRLGDHAFDNERTRRSLAGLGCPLPPADTRWIDRMFEYFRSHGAVPLPEKERRKASHD